MEELIKELNELQATLKADGYKDWCYAQLTIDKAIQQLKNCNLQNVMRSTLQQKEESYKGICAWFENEYSPAFTDEDEVAEWNKKAAEVNAQIKLLRFLLSEYCA